MLVAKTIGGRAGLQRNKQTSFSHVQMEKGYENTSKFGGEGS